MSNQIENLLKQHLTTAEFEAEIVLALTHDLADADPQWGNSAYGLAAKMYATDARRALGKLKEALPNTIAIS